VIASAYNTREKVEKGTKTGAKKLIPVHPFAGRVPKAWHDEGWREWMGREPRVVVELRDTDPRRDPGPPAPTARGHPAFRAVATSK
jgi:hypothetical protein